MTEPFKIPLTELSKDDLLYGPVIFISIKKPDVDLDELVGKYVWLVGRGDMAYKIQEAKDEEDEEGEVTLVLVDITLEELRSLQEMTDLEGNYSMTEFVEQTYGKQSKVEAWASLRSIIIGAIPPEEMRQDAVREILRKGRGKFNAAWDLIAERDGEGQCD